MNIINGYSMPVDGLSPARLQWAGWGLCLSLCLLFACQSPQPASRPDLPPGVSAALYPVEIKHAEGLWFSYQDSVCRVTFLRGQADTSYLVLLPKGGQVPVAWAAHPQLSVPVQRVVALSTPHLAMIEAVGGLEALKGIERPDYVYSPGIRARVEAGQVQALGSQQTLNREALLGLEADLVLGSATGDLLPPPLQAIQQLGIPVLAIAEWQESSPLGRAEWIKLFGLLLGKGQAAVRHFTSVEQAYMALTQRLDSVSEQPSVIVNAPFQGIWSMPAGDSYMASLLADVRATYAWAETPGTGALPLDLEAVYPVGLQAPYWLNPGLARDYEALLAQDERFRDFRSVSLQQVFHCYARTQTGGANDYWESAVVNPHEVLADFAKALHPELMQDHDWVYVAPFPRR